VLFETSIEGPHVHFVAVQAHDFGQLGYLGRTPVLVLLKLVFEQLLLVLGEAALSS